MTPRLAVITSAFALALSIGTQVNAAEPAKTPPSREYGKLIVHEADPRWLLHTKARRYCIERFDYWVARYGEMNSERQPGSIYAYSDEALNIFPRYNLMIALSRDIERYRPTDFESVDSLRAALINSGTSATAFMVEPSKRVYPKDASAEDVALFRRQEAVEATVIEDERRIFKEFIGQLLVADCVSVEPLPDRRTLSSAENEMADKYLEGVWGVDIPYWYPLGTSKQPQSVLALQSAWFHHDVTLETVKSILIENGIETVWKCNYINEHSYEFSIKDLEPGLGWGGEGYLFSLNRQDWAIYFSHESSITFGGDWLINAIKSSYPDWEKRLYTGWDYEYPTD